MFIVHVILNEPYTFNFTDSYSLKFSRQRTMKYSIAVIYTNEMLDLRDSRFNYMFKEIQENDYNELQCKKNDMISEFIKTPGEFNFCSITNVYSLPLLSGYKYNPELKVWVLR
jgi:hypothetical protein